MEIPCPICPTWSHFIQDKLEISIYLSLDKNKYIKKANNTQLIQFCISYFDYYELTCCIENSVDPDQLASSEASSSGSTLFTREVVSCFKLFSKEFIYCLRTVRYIKAMVICFFLTSKIYFGQVNFGHLLVPGQV